MMNTRRVLRASGIMLTVLSLTACPGDDVSGPGLSEGESGAGDESGGQDGAGQDRKTFDATNCVTHPDSLLAKFEVTMGGQYINVTTLPGHILCPINRDWPAGDGPWEVDVAAVDSSTTGAVTCTAIARDLQGDIVAQSATQSTEGVGGEQTLSLDVPGTEPFAYHYVDCLVAGQDSRTGGQSGLASFVTAESKAITEEIDRKLYPALNASYTTMSFLGPPPRIDEIGLAEVFITEAEGQITSLNLPLIRDDPDGSPERVRVHYYKEGGWLACSYLNHYDSGVDTNLAAGDLALEEPFGTIDILIPVLPISDGPYSISCSGNGRAAILAYDMDEP